MKTFTPEEIATIVDHALIALLWSEGEITDEDGNFTLDSWDEIYDYHDATPELRAELFAAVAWLDRADITDPIALQWRMAAHEYVSRHGLVQFGHDMTLTRGHHGAGFWDRGDGAVGRILTQWAESLGTLDLMHGSDAVEPLNVKWAGMFHAE